MFEFEIPEDVSSFSIEDLESAIAEAKREFNTLYEGDDLSDDALDRMTELADAIEVFHTGIQAIKREELALSALEVMVFHNTCHDENGRFCEGPDGPGRLRDNLKKAEAIVGKNAPKYMKLLLSRRLGKSRKKAEELLPKDSPQYLKDLLKRRLEQRTIKGD